MVYWRINCSGFCLIYADGLDDVVEEAGDGEGTDAAGDGSDGGEVGSFADCVGNVAFQNTVFAGGASVDKSGTRFYHRIGN